MGAVDEALHDIPPEYRERARELLAAQAVPNDELRVEVERYRATVEQVSRIVPMLDGEMALRLAGVITSLLDHLADMDDSEVSDHRGLVQMAARYLILEDDDEEVTGVLGFDDDIQVINAVCRAVGRDDLVTPLPARPA